MSKIQLDCPHLRKPVSKEQDEQIRKMSMSEGIPYCLAKEKFFSLKRWV